MKLQIAGISKQLVVLNAPPVAPGVGTDLGQFGVNGRKPASFHGRVRLTGAGAGSAEFVVYVRDATGWCIPVDAGNLGLIGGQALPSAAAPGLAYGFDLENIGSYLEVALVKQNEVGGAVVVTENTLEEVKDY
jgi:hypothetical protein